MRSAFEAVLEMDNNVDGEIANFEISLAIRSEEEPVNSTQNDRFFIPDPVIVGFTGGISGSGKLGSASSGSVTWLIRPTTDSAPSYSG